MAEVLMLILTLLKKKKKKKKKKAANKISSCLKVKSRETGGGEEEEAPAAATAPTIPSSANFSLTASLYQSVYLHNSHLLPATPPSSILHPSPGSAT